MQSTSATSRLTSVATPAGFTRRDRRSIAGMSAFVLMLHVVGWGVLVLAVAPHHYRLGSTGVLGVGVGLTAYMLGVRHAFDADHIASIDNTTRKLVGEGRPSVSTGSPPRASCRRDIRSPAEQGRATRCRSRPPPSGGHRRWRRGD